MNVTQSNSRRHLPCRSSFCCVDCPSPTEAARMSSRSNSRSALFFAFAVALAAPAYSGNVLNGATVDVTSAGPLEDWFVAYDSTLNVRPGARTGAVAVEANSVANFDHASVTASASANSLLGAVLATGSSGVRLFSSSIVHSGQRGIFLSRKAPDDLSPDPSYAELFDSSVVARTIAIQATAGTRISLSNSSLSTSGPDAFSTGLLAHNPSGIIVSNGSSIEGGNGIRLIIDSSPALRGDEAVVINASKVVGTTGSAIVATSSGGAAGENVTANIFVENGSQLIAGDGFLLAATTSIPFGSNPSPFTTNFTVTNSTLQGNVRAFRNGFTIANVTLASGGSITGAFSNVGNAKVMDGGHWQLTAASDVANLDLQAGGTVTMGDGSQFNSLTAGSFVGSGGTLAFNTVLAGDASATDHLHVLGDSSGQAYVKVANVGGAGAKTTNGIELIQVGGQSGAVFQLAGRAVGGPYDYFLTKNDSNGNWYLRSQVPTPPDPCVVDPSLPQ
ncbi:TPA: autotransporter outer membrane beta-barrel domain-containing protein, partial [Stenotrophomonas maltophilia]